MSSRMMTGLIGFTIGAVIFGGIAYTVMNSDLDTLKKSLTETVVIEKTGGLCVTKDGKGYICSSKETIYSNGHYSGGKNIPKDDMDKLKQLITQSNLDLLAQDGNPRCPSYSDGTDVSYVYPTKYDKTRYTLCRIINPQSDPLIAYTTKLVNEYSK